MPILTNINKNTRLIRDTSKFHHDYFNINNKKHRYVKQGLRGEVITVKGKVGVDPNTGLATFGSEQVVRKDPNDILMGGSIYALEKMFNVVCGVNVEYLNNIMNIATSGPAITDKYPRDNGICLWTVGLGGCGDSRKDIKHVFQQQRQLNHIIPFRVVDEPFKEGTEEFEKYYLMRQEADGKYAYYGKVFSKQPVIQPLWKDAGEDVDGSPVVESDYSSTRSTPIEVFVECVCSVEKEDFREWFALYDNIEEVRFNEIGLCTGILSSVADGRPDYKQVRQVSCCHFTNEPLHMEKDMSLIYRWYSA